MDIDATPEGKLFDRLERDQFDSSRAGAPWAVAGAVLTSQGALLRDLRSGRRLGAYLASLTAATLLFSAGYGAILGLFQPSFQTLFAAAKIPIVVLGTALLCTPTFYVFNSILGSRLSLPQTLGIVLFLAASASLVLVAFAPIAWLFTVSTGGPDFLAGLHVAIFLVAALYGFRSLDVGRRYLNFVDATQVAVNAKVLFLWFLLVLVVALQIAYYFRPLLLPGPFHLGERGLFLDVVMR